LIPFAQQLNAACRGESDADVRERIFLVRRVRVDKVQAASVAELELHRTRIWAYKWLKRYDIGGIGGLRDRRRSGRPPDVSDEKVLDIRRELSANPSGWRAKEVMGIIYKRTGIRYHEVHVYRLLHKWGFSPKVPRKRFVSAASKEEKNIFRKRLRR
jgi:putative transposase